MNYIPTIGLEAHVELNTGSKVFCGCSTKFGGGPNTQVCPICLGMPGVLPVLNRKAVEHTLTLAAALGCRIAAEARFDRKHYFYPDLPKNYQISEYDQPIASAGKLELELNGIKKIIGLRRIHLEEDAGKNLHAEDTGLEDVSLVDFNRAGVPLMEIVTEPDLHSLQEVEAYMNTLRDILLHLGISDCKMEAGSIRFEANVSLALASDAAKGVRVEIKNLNSFRSVIGAVAYEIKKQSDILNAGEKVKLETKLWDEKLKVTEPMRAKEEAHDYRYFPEPDLVPLHLTAAWVEEIKKRLPELPSPKRERFIRDYGLSPYDAQVLISSPLLASFFEETVAIISPARDSPGPGFLRNPASLGMLTYPKMVSNWLMVEVLGAIKERGEDLSSIRLTPEKLASLLKMVVDGAISGKIAKEVLPEILETGRGPEEIVKEKGLAQIGGRVEIEEAVGRVLKENAETVAQYRAGKEKAFIFLVGQVMKRTKGRANPSLVNEILRKLLNKVNSQ